MSDSSLQPVLPGGDGGGGSRRADGRSFSCGNWLSGSTRFNDLRRGVPRMSPALLSKRLKELEAAGDRHARARCRRARA